MFKEVLRFVSERVGSGTFRNPDGSGSESTSNSPVKTTMHGNGTLTGSSLDVEAPSRSTQRRRTEDSLPRYAPPSSTYRELDQRSGAAGATRGYATLATPSRVHRQVTSATSDGDRVSLQGNNNLLSASGRTSKFGGSTSRLSSKQPHPVARELSRGRQRDRERSSLQMAVASNSCAEVNGSYSNISTMSSLANENPNVSTPKMVRSHKQLAQSNERLEPAPAWLGGGGVSVSVYAPFASASASGSAASSPSPSPCVRSTQLIAADCCPSNASVAAAAAAATSPAPYCRPKPINACCNSLQARSVANLNQTLGSQASMPMSAASVPKLRGSLEMNSNPNASAVCNSRCGAVIGTGIAASDCGVSPACWSSCGQRLAAPALAPTPTPAWTWTSAGDGDRECFSNSEHSSALLRRIRELAFGAGAERGEREQLTSLCDVTLVVSDEDVEGREQDREHRIAAHRVVLSAASEYFEALFSAAMRESRTHEVYVVGVDVETMQRLVDYIYSGMLELREDSVEHLLAAACRFRLDAAVAACSSFLGRRLQPANCVGIWQFAERHACDALRLAAFHFCCEHFCELAVLDEFLLLAVDELERLLRAQDLNVPDEESVYCALVRWLQYDFDSRLGHFARLLRSIRLPLLSKTFLLNEIDLNPALQSNSDVLRLVVAALKYHVAKARDSELLVAQVNAAINRRSLAPANASANAISISTVNEQTSPPVTSCCESADRAGESRLRTSQALDKQQYVPRRSMCGSLWIIGGVDASNKCSVLVERLNYYTNAFETVTQLPTKRLQFGAALLEAPASKSANAGRSGATPDRFLLIVGGRDGLKTLNTVDAFGLQQRGCWLPMPGMATPRHGLGVAVLNNVLYAVGGHDGWSYLNTVERFELATRSWSYCAPLSVARSTCGVVACGQRLYAIGGRDGSSCLRSVESFDPHSQKWTACASMHLRRGGVACTELDGFVYAVGGHDAPTNNPNAGRLDAVERYDPRNDQWTVVSPLGGPRDALAVGSIGGYLLAAGGFDGHQYLSSVQFYDDESNEWHDAPPLRTGRAGAAAVLVRHISSPPTSSVATTLEVSSRPSSGSMSISSSYSTKSDSISKRSSLVDTEVNVAVVRHGGCSNGPCATSHENPVGAVTPALPRQ